MDFSFVLLNIILVHGPRLWSWYQQDDEGVRFLTFPLMEWEECDFLALDFQWPNGCSNGAVRMGLFE
nr:MAG: hypothetical protein BECKLFY1418A_GA0070994_10595 [Candidatus Kentron sp. LFY]